MIGMSFRFGVLPNASRVGPALVPIGSPLWFDDRSSIGWVRISDVTRSRRYLKETTQRLSDAGIRSSRFVGRGGLIMSICATVGRPIETRVDSCIHDGFVVFEEPTIDQSFLYHVLSSLEPTWSRRGQTGSQMNLNTGLIKGRLVAIPSTTSEQRVIAVALDDVDALLDGLDRLIAKKRNLKQATMQQFLTGQTRLPGFHGEWETQQVVEIGTTYGGLTGKTKVDFGVGHARYVTFLNVLENVVIDPHQCEPVCVESGERQNTVRRGDVLFNGTSETPDDLAMAAVTQIDEDNLFLKQFFVSALGYTTRTSTYRSFWPTTSEGLPGARSCTRWLRVRPDTTCRRASS